MARRLSPVLPALALYLVWTAATWLLEGRILTLRRPEAVLDRVLYALIANIAIGTVGAVWLLRRLVRETATTRGESGFGSPARETLMVTFGLALGFGFYAIQKPPTFHPVVLANAFAQVLVVSIAEVLVCWSVVGAAVRMATRGWSAVPSYLTTAVVASVLFGVYHFAHSPPFNTAPMVALLTGVGLVTSLFFFLSRSVYGTIAFHNFLGLFGIVGALSRGDRLDVFRSPMPPLYVMALLAVAVLVLMDAIVLRHSHRQA